MPVTRSGRSSMPVDHEGRGSTVNAVKHVSASSIDENGYGVRRTARDKKRATTGAPRRDLRDKTNLQHSNESKDQQQQHQECLNEANTEKRGSRMLPQSFVEARALKDLADAAFKEAKYTSSIELYTTAMALLKSDSTIPLSKKEKELLASLWGNRATALMKVEAYEAADADCANAISVIIPPMSDMTTLNLNGPEIELSLLLARYACCRGYALLKMGKDVQANEAFSRTITVCDTVLGQLKDTTISDADTFNQSLLQIKKDACQGTEDVEWFLVCLSLVSEEDDQSLCFLNRALTIAPACLATIYKKVKFLASRGQWTQVSFVCESLACATVRLSSVWLNDDLAKYNPFPRAPEPSSLKIDSLTSSTSPVSSDGKYRILGATETAEVPCRLPTHVLPIYFQSLHLEERFSREAYQTAKRSCPFNSDLPSDFLELLEFKAKKEQADRFLRFGGFFVAAECYTDCLKTKGVHHYANGGKLQAVLLGSRAACHFGMRRYEDAVKDCTAALAIRPNYLKVLLCKARSLKELGRFIESGTNYWEWKSAVDYGKLQPKLSTTSGSLEALHDITDEERQCEWDEWRKVMQNVIATAAAEAPLQDPSFFVEKYQRMLKVGLPEGAVRQKMSMEQVSLVVLEMVFPSKKMMPNTAATPSSLSEEEESKIRIPNDGVEQKSEMENRSNRLQEALFGSPKKEEPPATASATAAVTATATTAETATAAQTATATETVTATETATATAIATPEEEEKANDLSFASSSTAASPSLSEEEQRLLDKYRRMLTVGVCKKAVVQKMVMEGCPDRVKEALFGTVTLAPEEEEKPNKNRHTRDGYLEDSSNVAHAVSNFAEGDESSENNNAIRILSPNAGGSGGGIQTPCGHKKRKRDLLTVHWTRLSPTTVSNSIWGEIKSTASGSESNADTTLMVEEDDIPELEQAFKRKKSQPPLLRKLLDQETLGGQR